VVAAIAVVGVTMLTMGSAARRAAADVREMTKALTATMDQLRFEAGLMTPYEKSVADVKAQYEAARKQVKDKAEREVDAISPWTTRWHKAKRTDEIWTEAQKALDEINRLEAIRLGQLGKEKDAINDVIKSSIGMVAGYRYQAAIFAASNARSAPASPNAPAPVGGGSTGGTGGGGGNGGEEGGDLTVVVQMADGAVLGNAVIRNFKARAQRQFGDTSRWSEIT
jgi:hypothetical protein